MATKRRSTKSSSQRGSTLYGVLAGVLLGLVVAAVVAFYVTQTPNPFVDRASRDSTPTRPPGPQSTAAVPDPNGGLYGRDGAAGTAPVGPTATAPAPLPGVTPQQAPTGSPRNELDELIAKLPDTPAAPVAAPTPAPAAAGSAATPAASRPDKPTTPAPTAAKPAAKGIYLLQAGAFRNNTDAESLRARIILLGLPVNVQRAEVNGAQIHRVRVGPFARLDDMNRARVMLGENKIESAVVRE